MVGHDQATGLLADSGADLLVYGIGERAVVEIAHRFAAGERPDQITDLRGTAFVRPSGPRDGWSEIDSRDVDAPGPIAPPADPYAEKAADDYARPPRGRRSSRGATSARARTEPAL